MTTMNKDKTQSTAVPELLEQIQPIVENLPDIEYHSRANGEIDFYGASFCIARQLCLKKPLFSRATWTHGWNWYDITSPVMLVDAEHKNSSNLVISQEIAQFLKHYGHSRAVAVGAPFIYADAGPARVPRIPGSILVFPKHCTKSAIHNVNDVAANYIEYIQELQNRFNLVAVSVGYEDVRKGNWISELEKAGIPWIAGAWSHDENALLRMHILLRQFEFVTSNTTGSHFAYAAYCGCKVSFHGPECMLEKKELNSHFYFKRYPAIALEFQSRDFVEEFRTKFPFFFVEPQESTTQVEWAHQALGAENKKHPEEIAELFEWKIRRLPSGSWVPINPHDILTNEELLAKAYAKTIVGQHDEAFKLTNILKHRHARLKDVEIIRARFFLNNKNTYAAREALKEELRHFPDNAQAAKLFQELGGDVLTPYVAKNEDEQEFIAILNTVRPYTRLNIKRAKSLYDLAVRVCQENVPGNFVECGVAAGGSTMLLALVVKKHSKIPRKVFAFDTFTGMPDPGEADMAKGVPADDTGWGTGTCAAPEEFVQVQCRRLGVGGLVVTRKGLFETTLPEHRAEIGQIALLHMDADWYASTMTILDNLFDQLNDSALIQIDDYGAWDGCKKAILDYSAQHDLFFDVQEIDGTGVWCAKPTQSGKKPAVRLVPPCDEAFLSPRLSPEFADLYLVRKKILERLEQVIPDFSGVLLDVGCGQMPYREHILFKNPNITRYIGLDFAQGKYAELRQPDLTWDGRSIPLADGSVDCAMATEVLEHCFDPSIVLREIRRVLKHGGIFFFTTPFLWPIHDAPHDHFRFTPYALQRLLVEAGFDDIRILAMGGWNAALAQMIGLWFKRATMPESTRKQAVKELFPFYKQLITSDILPENYYSGPMITALSGTARRNNSKIISNINKYHCKNYKNVQLSNKNKISTTRIKKQIIITNIFPKISETFILSQITGLIDQGFEVEIWIREKSNETVIHQDVIKYKLLEKVKLVKIPPVSNKNGESWIDVFFKINDIKVENISLFHVHFGINFNVFQSLFVNVSIPVIVSFHGLDASQYIQTHGGRCYDFLFNRACLITTPSKKMKDILVSIGCDENKIYVHRYGVNLQYFKPAVHNDSSNFYFLSVARFVEKKGLEFSLRAFAVFKDTQNVYYRIIGEGPLKDDLVNMIKELDIEDKVVFLGAKDKSDVLKEMRRAHVYVLTSVTAQNGDQEGLPVTLIEAHACGLPVISSIHAGIPELVDNKKTGFLCQEKSIECIAKYMKILYEHKDIRSMMAENARKKVENEFDIRKLSLKLGEIYNLVSTGQK